MDNFLIILIIFGIILWLVKMDSKRRDNNIKKRWNEVKNYRPIIQYGQAEVGVTKKQLNDISIDGAIKRFADYVAEQEMQEKNKDTFEISPETIDSISNKLIDEMEPDNKSVDDAFLALTRLGYRKTKVSNAIEEVTKNYTKKLTTEEIVKNSLNILNK